jgi:hypothetical protein
MTDTARVVLGLTAALAVSPFLPRCGQSRLTAALAAAVVCSWTLYPGGARLWPSILAGAVVLIVAIVSGTTEHSVTEATPTWPRRSMAPLFFAALILLVSVLAALTVDPDSLGHALRSAARSDSSFVYAIGLLAGLFPAGALIGVLTRRWSAAIQERLVASGETLVQGLEGAGRYIGWLERTLIYCALVLGHIDAAILVLTAKSIARFPSFKDEAFAEYFLIGTLLSVVAGGAAAIFVRLLLGLPAI